MNVNQYKNLSLHYIGENKIIYLFKRTTYIKYRSNKKVNKKYIQYG